VNEVYDALTVKVKQGGTQPMQVELAVDLSFGPGKDVYKSSDLSLPTCPTCDLGQRIQEVFSSDKSL
jgi:hypothetical protein